MPSDRQRPPLYIQLLKAARVPIESLILRLSTVSEMEFYNTAEFPWVKEIESYWPEIAEELRQLFAAQIPIPPIQEISRPQARLSQDSKWKTYILVGHGSINKINCERCPRTYEAIRRIPGLNLGMFSILEPGKHIPPHRGPYKGILRYHLAISVPDDPSLCAIRVGTQTRNWIEGNSLVFDDTFEHEAWNTSSQTRVVLFVDFLRPMNRLGSLLNRSILRLLRLTPYVKEARAALVRFQESTKGSLSSPKS